MAVFVPTTTYINYGKISQFLAANRITQNRLFKGEDKAPNLSWLIELVRKSIEWKNGIDSTDESLNDTSLYLYDLCGRYIRDAKIILNGGSTGTLINPTTGNQVTIATPSYQFKIGEVGALMTAGETTLTITLSGIVNGSAEITLDGVEVPYGRSDVFSYTATYSATNIIIVFNNPVVNTQLFLIHLIQLVNI